MVDLDDPSGSWWLWSKRPWSSSVGIVVLGKEGIRRRQPYDYQKVDASDQTTKRYWSVHGANNGLNSWGRRSQAWKWNRKKTWCDTRSLSINPNHSCQEFEFVWRQDENRWYHRLESGSSNNWNAKQQKKKLHYSLLFHSPHHRSSCCPNDPRRYPFNWKYGCTYGLILKKWSSLPHWETRP